MRVLRERFIGREQWLLWRGCDLESQHGSFSVLPLGLATYRLAGCYCLIIYEPSLELAVFGWLVLRLLANGVCLMLKRMDHGTFSSNLCQLFTFLC